MVFNGKKGSSNDIIFIGILVFIIALALFVTHFMFTTAINQIITKPYLNETASFVGAMEGTKNMMNKFDYVIIGLFFGLSLAILITGWLVGGIPIFMIIYFLVVIIAVVLSAVLSYFWQTFSVASVFGTTINSFPMTNHLLTNLQIYVAVVGMIGMVVMFGKPYFSGDNGGIP